MRFSASILVGLFSICLLSCNSENQDKSNAASNNNIDLNIQQADRLARLPLKCIQSPLPYKSGHVLAKESDLQMPQLHHPTFYGCFDWHSAVHGHWMAINLMKNFPNLSLSDSLRMILDQNLTAENITQEVKYFSLNRYTKNFERTYGWAWLLKLQEELLTWDDPQGQKWAENLQPLADHIVNAYLGYLPKLNYPIRVGEHSNTAFGLTFALDYAITTDHRELRKLIETRALDFFLDDTDCPVSWEPSGYDFLSPCLEEAELMQRVLPKEEFLTWFGRFLPQFANPQTAELSPGMVSDRTDGKLVHLDGLNFSRAWCLYRIASEDILLSHLSQIADNHLQFSLSNVVDGDYSGEHWLGSFAVYALNAKTTNLD